MSRDIENYRAWDKARYAQRRKLNPRYRAMILNNGAKRRAASKGWDFDLDIDWVAEKVERGFCEVTGIPFKLDYRYEEEGYGTQRAFSPSLDRSDPTKGYTKDNTKVVVWIYNAAKGVETHDAVLILAEALLATE